MLKFEVELEKDWLEIDLEAEFGENWNPTKKEITLILHNINWNPKRIKVDGKRKKIEPSNNQLTIPFTWKTKKEAKIKISLK